jgi:hypothetical protein
VGQSAKILSGKFRVSITKIFADDSILLVLLLVLEFSQRKIEDEDENEGRGGFP